MVHDFDIIIIGGGMVGAAMANALGDLPFRVAVIEAMRPNATDHVSFDDRALVLSEGTRRFLARLGVWARVSESATPIRHIHVSDRGHFGATRLHADQEGVEALGQVVEARALGGALHRSMAALGQTEVVCPAELVGVEPARDGTRIIIEQEGLRRVLTGRLAIAADGGASATRELVGAQARRFGYGQTAIIANVLTDRPHGGVAYERFTDSGPLALLPFSRSRGEHDEERLSRRWSLVWTARDRDVESVLELEETDFLGQLQRRFGGRAGRFVEAGPRTAYPLRLEFLTRPVRERLVLIGNAAHTIHPVAGQGLNLGLRDVAHLRRVLRDAKGADPGSAAILRRYGNGRRLDYAGTIGLTDSLARLFSTDSFPLVAARNVGMVALDTLPPLRHLFARQAMGLGGWSA